MNETNINALLSVRKKVANINLFFVLFFIIIGFYAYKSNKNMVELNLMGININHFSTFFGGSSALLFFIFYIIPIICSIKKNKECMYNLPKIYYTYLIEITVLCFALIGTLLFSIDHEFTQAIERWEKWDNIVLKDQLLWDIFIQSNEIISDILGFIFFLLMNVYLYSYFYLSTRE